MHRKKRSTKLEKRNLPNKFPQPNFHLYKKPDTVRYPMGNLPKKQTWNPTKNLLVCRRFSFFEGDFAQVPAIRTSPSHRVPSLPAQRQWPSIQLIGLRCNIIPNSGREQSSYKIIKMLNIPEFNTSESQLI